MTKQLIHYFDTITIGDTNTATTGSDLVFSVISMSDEAITLNPSQQKEIDW